MPNPEHVELVKQGAEAINKWREKNPNVALDLSAADLRDLGKGDFDFLYEAHLEDAKLTRANLEGAQLGGARLECANLASAKLKGAHLIGTYLEGAWIANADLEGADLAGARLAGAGLNTAHLKDARLSNADLGGAEITYVNLDGACMFGANLEGAEITGTSLDGADLRVADPAPWWRHYIPLVRLRHSFTLDSCRVHRTQFSPRSNDQWSILRRTYTGPRFILTLLLLIAFVVPQLAEAMFWGAVRQSEDRIRVFQAELARRELDIAIEHRSSALAPNDDRLLREIRSLITPPHGRTRLHQALELVRSRIGDLERLMGAEASSRLLTLLQQRFDFEDEQKWTPRRVWTLILNFDKPGWGPFVLACALIAFNVLRGYIMWFVAPMRDAEERSHVSPAKEDYARFYWLHAGPLRLLLYVAVIAFAVQFVSLLFTEVFIPVTG